MPAEYVEKVDDFVTHFRDYCDGPWKCTVNVVPHPKERPRGNWRGGRAYTPAKTRAYEAYLRDFFKAQLEYNPVPWDVASDDNEFYVHLLIHRKFDRGDLDNMVKGVTDSMNGVIVRDDRYIAAITARRYNDKKQPRIEIKVWRKPRHVKKAKGKSRTEEDGAGTVLLDATG